MPWFDVVSGFAIVRAVVLKKGSSYGGLVVKSCAIPVWKLSFVLILGPWPHIGPVPGATLRCLWGPGSLPS